MDFEKANIADPIHFINNKEFEIRECINHKQIYLVGNQFNQEYYLIKKDEQFDPDMKYSIINYLEKSFNLIHPAIINLAGYSIEKPYLYYEYSKHNFSLRRITIKYEIESVQKIFIGIASALSYLISKGYYLSNFSIDSILIDLNSNPKIINYIDFNDLEERKGNKEDELLKKYANFLDMSLEKIKNEDQFFQINGELETLIKNCKKKDQKPTFNDFIEFFKSSTFCGNQGPIKTMSYGKYLEVLELRDVMIYDKYISTDKSYSINYDKLEQICFYFFQNRKTKTYFRCQDYFLLDTLPEYYIKPLSKISQILYNKFIRFLYNEDISLIIPNWKKIYEEKDFFDIYIELMKQIDILEKQKNDMIYFNEKRKKIEYKIDALRIQAIYFLKKKYKQTGDPKIKIEMAVQYIKGIILPYNMKKALNILDSISNYDKQTKKFVNQMKKKLREKINEESLDDFIDLEERHDVLEILKKAKNGHVLSMLYSAFSFYTGFNGLPIKRSLAIQLYRNAAKKSPDAMSLLGYLYYNGIFFPQNLKRARNCFKRAADKGCTKAEIIDGLLRKHLWRTYLVEFEINELFNSYIEIFQSAIPNDSLIFPLMNYNLNTTSLNYSCILRLDNIDADLNLNGFMNLTTNNYEGWTREIQRSYSEKVLLSNERIIDLNNVNKQMFIAKSYFNGDHNYPVNYKKAAKYFKMAADNDNSEAQWRYALLLYNSIGEKCDLKTVKRYFKKSSNNNNIKGKFYYAIFIKENKNDTNGFEKLIKECCDAGDTVAMYYYAMYLEDKSLEQSILYYKKASDLGHFDSFIRLTYLYKNTEQVELYHNCLKLAVGLLNEKLFRKLIRIYDRNEQYELSNTLIKVGLMMNYQSFNYFYSEHNLNGRKMEKNIERAKKIAILAFEDDYKYIYQQKYIYLLLEILATNNEHLLALEFLLKISNQLNDKYRKYFLRFFEKFDKNLARKYFISPFFCVQEYRQCFEILIKFENKETNLLKCFEELNDLVNRENSYAMAILGRIYKRGNYILRDLKTALVHINQSAKSKCPLGYYYLGKEFFYGRYVEQNLDEARRYLNKAKENDVYRAGYYLFEISRLESKNKNYNDLKIGVQYGHKRALHEYGVYQYYEGDRSEGINLIQQACEQNYKKSIKFCLFHPISIKRKKAINEGKNNKKNQTEKNNKEDQTEKNNKEDQTEKNIKKNQTEKNNKEDQTEKNNKENQTEKNKAIIETDEDFINKFLYLDMQECVIQESISPKQVKPTKSIKSKKSTKTIDNTQNTNIIEKKETELSIAENDDDDSISDIIDYWA